MMIYDQPDHATYGPCRRLHVMLLQLYANNDLAVLERGYERQFMIKWTDDIDYLIQVSKWTEAQAQRHVLSRFFTFCR